MSLLCHVFDHKRSSSRASFDHVNQCWVSECKRCLAVLVRDGPGEWREAPAEPPASLHSYGAGVRSVGFTLVRDPDFDIAYVPRSVRSAGFTIMGDVRATA